MNEYDVKRENWAKRIARRVEHFELYTFRESEYHRDADGKGYFDERTVADVTYTGRDENGDRCYENESISLSDLETIRDADIVRELVDRGPEAVYLEFPYCSGSDYSGSSLEKSNYRVLAAAFAGQSYSDEYVGNVDGNHTFPGVHCYTGGHGTFGLVVSVATYLRYKEIRETIENLENYPVADEQDMSFLEMQLADDDWDCWAQHDFTRELERKFDCEISWKSDNGHCLSRSYFESCREACNVYWESETGGNMHVDVRRIVDSIDSLDYVPRYSYDKRSLRDCADIIENDVGGDESDDETAAADGIDLDNTTNNE